MESENRYFSATLRLVVAMGLLHLFMALYLDLKPDVGYYWELSRRLDWSYYDHPPMVAYIIAFFRLLLGDTHLAIRLPSILTSAIGSLILFQIGREFLGNPRIGFIAAFLFNLTPAGMAIGFITTPDTPLALFWLTGMYSFLKAINSESDFWWALTGISLGFGAMSKYNMIFFVPAVALTVIAFPRYRHLMLTRRYWLMVGLAGLGTLPVLYWNHTHDWISFKFQFDHGLKPNTRGLFKNLGDFLGGQLGTIGLTLFPVLWFAALKYARVTLSRLDEVRFFLVWLALPKMSFFVYTGMKSKVEANWPQIAYLSAMLLVAEWICAGEGSRRRNWVIAPSAFLAFLVVIQSLTLIIPLPPNADISTRLHGWRKMGEVVQRFDADTGYKAVFVGQGAPLATLVGFYGKIPSERLAEIHGGGNFQFWWQNRELAAGSEVIYVDDDKFSEAMNFARFFTASESIKIPVTYAGRHIRNINFTRLSNLNSNLKFK
ncbi:MAG: glycosyltransferase family 39 protein [Candidatus Riflebacteria bacterium]